MVNHFSEKEKKNTKTFKKGKYFMLNEINNTELMPYKVLLRVRKIILPACDMTIDLYHVRITTYFRFKMSLIPIAWVKVTSIFQKKICNTGFIKMKDYIY